MVNNKKYNVKLNSVEKIEQLLQETYDLACQQHTTIQNEINKVMNTTIVNDLDIDGKEKYGKIMKEYFTLQQKSIVIKMDLAKLMSEILKHNGDINKALEEESMKSSKLDLAALRKLAKDANTSVSGDTQTYNIK
jgi:hypothetical protein